MNNNCDKKVLRGRAAQNIICGLLVALVALAVCSRATAQGNTDDNTNLSPTLKFKGGIGVIPVTGVAANGTVNLNVVRGVTPAAPWRIADLEAEVGLRRTYQGRGTRFASGGWQWHRNQRGAERSRHAVLGPLPRATAHNSNPAGVALEPTGISESTIS